MRWIGSSYNGDGCERQPSSAACSFALLFLAVSLAGCSGIGKSGGQLVSDRQLTTSAVHKVSARGSGKVDPSDWETVRGAIAKADANRRYNSSIDWNNSKTGSTGTITIFNTIPATNDRDCRNFSTTINDDRGIRHYRGEACLLADDSWRLFSVLADDSELL